MSDQITLRKASRRDASAISAVAREAWAELGPSSGLARMGGPLTPEQALERLNAYGRRGAMFVCHVDRRPAGFAVVASAGDDPEMATLGVWVLPRYRRRGLAHQLTLMAIDFARRQGYRKLEGTIPKDNEAALSFFSDIGALVPLVAGGMKYELPV